MHNMNIVTTDPFYRQYELEESLQGLENVHIKKRVIETFQKWSHPTIMCEAKCCRLPILFPTTSHAAHCASRMKMLMKGACCWLPCFATLGHYLRIWTQNDTHARNARNVSRNHIKSMDGQIWVVRAVFRFHILRRCCVKLKICF
jgi:hypothetical protein